MAQRHQPVPRTGVPCKHLCRRHTQKLTVYSTARAALAFCGPEYLKAVHDACKRLSVECVVLAPDELHVLEGCAHGAWCYNGKGECSCSNGVAGYDDTMDTCAHPSPASH